MKNFIYSISNLINDEYHILTKHIDLKDLQTAIELVSLFAPKIAKSKVSNIQAENIKAGCTNFLCFEDLDNDDLQKLPANAKLNIIPLPVGDPWGFFEYFKTLKTKNLLEVSVKDREESVLRHFNAIFERGDKSNAIFITENICVGRLGANGIKRFVPALKRINRPDTRRFIYSSSYPCRFPEENKKFQKKIATVREKLSDDASKEQYDLVLYGSPEELFANYDQRVWSSRQYLEHAPDLKNKIVLNLEVCEGSEIPWILAKGVKKLINVDPFGASQLSNYVKLWTSKNKDKIFNCDACVGNTSGNGRFITFKGQVRGVAPADYTNQDLKTGQAFADYTIKTLPDIITCSR